MLEIDECVTPENAQVTALFRAAVEPSFQTYKNQISQRLLLWVFSSFSVVFVFEFRFKDFERFSN